MFSLGLDIGGTKVEIALYQENLVFIESVRIPTDRLLGYESLVSRTSGAMLQLCKKHSIDLCHISFCGISITGSVHPKTFQITKSNTLILKDQFFAHDIQRTSGLVHTSFFLGNDANCFAYAEAMLGAGATYASQYGVPQTEQISIGIILGSGVGGGIVHNGHIWQGAHGGGGELGHTLLKPNGLGCYCGNFGCTEQYLSGHALEGRFAARSYSQQKHLPHAGEIFDLFSKKDPIAMGVLFEYKKDLLDFLYSLQCAFDNHYFVLGGGLSKQADLYTGLKESLFARSFIEKKPMIYQHVLGDSAGVLGALLLAKQYGKVL
jgi:fructokinase